MSSLIDMVGAAILFGVLILTVARVQGNLNSTMYQNTYNIATQSQAVALARQLEYDAAKIGYRVSGSKISVADSTKLTFTGALTYGGAIDSVSYYTGVPDTSTMNPNDFLFVRYSKNGGTISMHIVMTYFKITYFDTSHVQMSMPITGSGLSAIRGINIKFRVESREPVQDYSTGIANYYAVTWEKLIYPRNLGKPF